MRRALSLPPANLFLSAVLVLTLILLPALPGSAQPDVEGRWIGPVETPLIGIHSLMMPTGKFLQFCYPLTVQDRSESWVFDPRSRSITPAMPDVDLFCGGHSFLPDGRLFVTGGDAPCAPKQICGGRYTRIFDPFTETWSDGPIMSRGRWYPTNKTLPGGKVLITSGIDGNGAGNPLVEIYDPATNELSRLRGADAYLPLYPWLHVMRSGLVFLAGPIPETYNLSIDFAQWYYVGDSNYGERHDGTSVLLAGLKRVMIIGGGHDQEVTNTVEMIDFNDAVPQWRYVAPMAFPRQDANALLLPDKTVLVTGGHMGHESLPVRVPELYDPATDTWTPLAPDPEARMYHSTSTLLPSGLVVSAGTDFNNRVTAFKPPYFFKGPRPRLGAVPAEASYGETIQVNSVDAAIIDSVVLIRPTAVTHSFNHEQRLVNLAFQADGANRLQVTIPPSAKAAPQGYYMLFVVDGDKLPSRGKWIRIDR